MGHCHPRIAAVMIIILTSFNTLLFTFSNMQESIHVFFAVCLGVILWQLSLHRENRRLRMRLILLYIAVLMVFTLFRPLWIIWLLALAPFIRSWREAAAGLCELSVPDERIQFLYDAALRTLTSHLPGASGMCSRCL